MWSDYYYWYSPWHRPWRWYRPYAYWTQWYWYPHSFYNDFWYYDWWYNDWYYPAWTYSSMWYGPGYTYYYGYPYYHHSGYGSHNRYDNDSPYRDNRRDNLRRVEPNNMVASNSTRSGGSYRRANPQIDQISGGRTTRTPVTDDVKNPVTERGTTNYRRVTGTTNSEAVYRDPSTNTRSRSEQTTGTRFTADLPTCHKTTGTTTVPPPHRLPSTRGTAAVFTGVIRQVLQGSTIIPEHHA